MAEGKTFVFIFPLLPGHINPTFPVAKALIAKGHKVHYICRPVMKDAIEATGATFHDDNEVYKTMYTGRQVDVMGFGVDLKAELGMDQPPNVGFMKGIGATTFRMLELKLEDLVPWLKEKKPHAIMYCPMLSGEGGYAGKICDIPHFALNTVAGPGALKPSYEALLAGIDGITVDELGEWGKTCKPRSEAIARLNETYPVLKIVDTDYNKGMLGVLPCVLQGDKVSLVTTIDALMEPMTPELAAAYKAAGVTWEGVGPLVGDEGDTRAAVMRKAATDELHAADAASVLEKVRSAKKAGRKVVLVSMGSLVTGDDPDLGWESQPKGEDGEPRGLKSKDVVRSAWGAVFDAVGKPNENEGPLIIVSIGVQKDALGDLQKPANSICQQFVPQIDILKEGVDCFVMGGGQNGFQEGLMNGAPFVVCPVVSDQNVQAGIAQAKGFGETISRPNPNPGEQEAAKATYRADVKAKVEMVLADTKYMKVVQEVKLQFLAAKGVARVVELLEDARGTSGKRATVRGAGPQAGDKGENVAEPCCNGCTVM